MSKPTAGSKYHAYMQGWRDGAARRAYRHEKGDPGKDPKLVEVYLGAYSDGLKAACIAATRAAEKFKYTPSVLR